MFKWVREHMEQEPSSKDETAEVDDPLRLAQERVGRFYKLLDEQAAATHHPNLIRRAIDEAMERARPTEIVDLPDDEQ